MTMKKAAFVMAVFAVLAGAMAVRAAEMECEHPHATIEALRMCVDHAWEKEHIDNKGIYRSLLAKLDAAETALAQTPPDIDLAIEYLEDFTREVHAQAGKHIDENHAHHMAMHAEHVIAALRIP